MGTIPSLKNRVRLRPVDVRREGENVRRFAFALFYRQWLSARSIGYRHENETSAVSLAQRRPAETDLPQPIEIGASPSSLSLRSSFAGHASL
jgi:hypothetical protein